MLEAVVLVGGQGTRLRPLTFTTPKPLLPVAGVPFLAHQFAKARDAGVTRLVLATSYRSELFYETFGDGEELGLELVYVTEDEPLGTGGAIRNVAESLTCGPHDPVVILNGDILSGHDLAAQIATHRAADADVTLHLVRVDDARAFGCVPTDEFGRVTAFLEKMSQPVSDQVNAGCYVFRRSVIDRIPAGRPVSVERETFPNLLAEGAQVRAYVETAYWSDLGSPAAFVQGSSDLVRGVVQSSAVPGPVGEWLQLDQNALGDGTHVGGGSVLGRHATVGSHVRIESSVLMDEVTIGDRAAITRSIIGRGATVGARAVLTDAVIGDLAVVGDDEQLDGVRRPSGD